MKKERKIKNERDGNPHFSPLQHEGLFTTRGLSASGLAVFDTIPANLEIKVITNL
jgi:hypothetical protein